MQVLGPGGTGHLTGIASVATGKGAHSLAVAEDGTVWAWGRNTYGQLGNASAADSGVPVQVHGPAGDGYLGDIVAVAAGNCHSLALRRDGSVWAWGYNNYGQLGDNSTTSRSVPVQVAGSGGIGYLTGVKGIAAGRDHTAALLTDGTVRTWGYNAGDVGRLGAGLTTIHSKTPVHVLGRGGEGYLSGVKMIALGDGHSAALTDDGTVRTRGENDGGKLGDGSTSDSGFPVDVVGPGGNGCLTEVSAVSAGGGHTPALLENGTVRSWGFGNAGQLGNGNTLSSAIPVTVVDWTGVFSLAGPTYGKGDVSEDGVVTVLDVLLGLRAAMGLPVTVGEEMHEPPYPAWLNACLDVNEDGECDICDVIEILCRALGYS